MSIEPIDRTETYDPVLHYTTRDTWLNDPNGLIFHNGVYHLYYQTNPRGNLWGNLSWGHATSRDLLTWQEQQVAISCDSNEAIFSGSIVYDKSNSSGLGSADRPPLVAVYTSNFTASSEMAGTQAQSLAYSLDEGNTWLKHAGSPVVTRNSAHFSDPKVFRYDHVDGPYWVMVAVEAEERQIVLYRSDDLKTWQYLSTFGPANAVEGIWECPDMFPLLLDGGSVQKWVLTVSVNPGGPNGGSAIQYFVGEFDGVRFASETPTLAAADDQSAPLWLDWGRDYYAAVSFNDAPDGRRITLGWMNNWEYAAETPASPWRGAMSLPRDLALVSTDLGPRIVQSVSPEVRRLIGAGRSYDFAPIVLRDERRTLEGATGVAQVIDARFTAGSACEFGLIVGGAASEETRIVVRAREGRLVVDRTESGCIDFHTSFPSVDEAPLEGDSGAYALTVYIDRCSVEVFAQGGLRVVTSLVFPSIPSAKVEVFADGGAASVEFLRASVLNESV